MRRTDPTFTKYAVEYTWRGEPCRTLPVPDHAEALRIANACGFVDARVVRVRTYLP